MVTPSAGAVVTVRFPFSDLSQSKLRPALVVADAGHNDWILCQITSKQYSDPSAVPLEDKDFSHDSLHLQSYVRPGKIFTASQDLMATEIGHLQNAAFQLVIDAIIALLQANIPAPNKQG